MIVIADSGSTKTDWRLVSQDGVIDSKQSIGLNPFFVDDEAFLKAVEGASLLQWPLSEVSKVFFYSAGITDEEIAATMEHRLKKLFLQAKISIESDLLAAARACYGTSSGVFGILGTGANSGYFDGHSITRNIPALGYLLGDEGSGSALGKRLVVAVYREELPGELVKLFRAFYPDHSNLLRDVYNAERPSQLLASLVPFIHRHLEDPVIQKLVEGEFGLYFSLIKRYPDVQKISLVGSVAYYFSDILNQVAESNALTIEKILQSPIEALTSYHEQTS